ncbi:CHRD domain-containing protein [Leeuwenhoekiella sp. UBA6783]|uniref:CHRD domain-containing protein n=3 Tax=unclassified Leeuwenhoekiella TaxID=2615029 RepID=UPI0025BAA1BE|nr:CHRD domain-containing protein [Leeuwenhoekiella sp. UBA6783]|tara:strand:+ start:66 stop:2756 length:2691 start_codon:yes stop_codon:yes gene_type:complete
MKKFYFLALSLFVLFACSEDDSPSQVEIGMQSTFDLMAVTASTDGQITFYENPDGSVNISLVTDSPLQGVNPAHIHFNTAAEGGEIALTLESIGDGEKYSVTRNVTSLDDGTPISYEELITFDGYVNIHQSADNLGTLLLQGDIGPNVLSGDSKTYQLVTKDVEGISGTATFTERSNGEVLLEVNLDGTPDGGMHPGHIHNNSAAETGGIALTLTTLDGTTGVSKTNITALDDGTPIDFEGLLNFDGYINFHLSADQLETLVAQGDIGENELTGDTKEYDLVTKDVEGISGTATFAKRKSGAALVTVMLDGTPDGGMHPGHIHNNSAAETGGIAKTLTTLDGTTGMSVTHIEALDDDTPIGYDDLLNFDGYINFHLSAEDLATLVAQGDIGENELTGETKVYDLNTKDVEGISGTATFAKRKSGAALVTVMLDGTPDGEMHPGHIHNNSAAETGGIAKTLTTLDGTTGMSVTHIESLDDDTPIGYDDLLNFDGYINFHLSAADLATLVAQGDIGENELTGETKVYDLETRDVPGISGTATFAERKSGAALVTVMLDGTPDGGMHPGHIHFNSAVETGDIAKTLTTLDGTTGMSITHIEALDDDTEIGYDGLLDFDGYINFHLSAADLPTLVAQGDIGANELTGNTKTYLLGSKDVATISGSALFSERKDGTTLVELNINGTPAGGMHPAHIHNNTAVEGGSIAITLGTVDGTTGMSAIQVETLDDYETPVSYSDLLDFDGYINVHLSAADLGTIVAQGDIGENELTGASKTYALNTKDVPGINGTARFEKRKNNETLVTLDIQGTPAGGEHPAHIHAGSVAEAPGDILITLTSVDGDTGMSQTNVTAFNAEDGTANEGDLITYDEMVAIDGYINVHLSAADLGTIVAQGNVGENAN